jgi:hypothetical protein
MFNPSESIVELVYVDFVLHEAGDPRRLVPECHEAAQCESEASISSLAHPCHALYDTGGDSLAWLRPDGS